MLHCPRSTTTKGAPWRRSPTCPSSSTRCASQLTEDFPGTIARLADIGFTRVEPFGMLAFAEQLKDSLANAGLSAPTAHQVLDGEDDVEAIFQAAVELNVDTVIHPFSPG